MWRMVDGIIYKSKKGELPYSCYGCDERLRYTRCNSAQMCIRDDIIWITAIPMLKRIRHPKF